MTKRKIKDVSCEIETKRLVLTIGYNFNIEISIMEEQNWVGEANVGTIERVPDSIKLHDGMTLHVAV